MAQAILNRFQIPLTFTSVLIFSAAAGTAAATRDASAVIKVEAGKLFESDSNCMRSYIYKNKTYPADSSRKPDGEGLRKILRTNPEAERSLNEYQSRLKALRWPAYVGGVGAASMVAGLIYPMQIESQLGKHDTRYLMIGTGGFLLLASYVYGQLGRRSNEKNLEKAIDAYNGLAGEGEKIKVNLTPLPAGNGARIETFVPF